MQETQKITNFKQLYTWKIGHELVLSIYQITKSFPREEIHGLTDQMRRAAVSITSNIAEGFGRKGLKEKIQFYYLSLGSSTELENQLIICHDIHYIDQNIYDKIQDQITQSQRLLSSLIQKSKSYLTKSSKEFTKEEE